MARSQPRWVHALRASLPVGWTITKSRQKIRLQVRSRGVSASTTLPLPWTPESLTPAVDLIRELEALVTDGHTLPDAALRVRAASSPAGIGRWNWAELVDLFQQDITLHGHQIKPTTWRRGYEPFLQRAVKLLTSARPPINATQLVGGVVADWSDKPRSRELAVQALDRFLRFCVADQGLPANSWTLSERDGRRFRGRRPERRVKACLTDGEIIGLIDSLPSELWRNAIKLMALYGLRPIELQHLTARKHPHTGQLAVWCGYRKTCGAKLTAPRWLLPCPLTDGFGEQVEWQLPERLAAGLLPLPPMATTNQNAAVQYLRRQPAWRALAAACEARGEWLRPYSLRDSYSLRCHRLGIDPGAISQAMGHSLSVHSTSYRWSSEQQTAEAFLAVQG